MYLQEWGFSASQESCIGATIQGLRRKTTNMTRPLTRRINIPHWVLLEIDIKPSWCSAKVREPGIESRANLPVHALNGKLATWSWKTANSIRIYFAEENEQHQRNLEYFQLLPICKFGAENILFNLAYRGCTMVDCSMHLLTSTCWDGSINRTVMGDAVAQWSEALHW